MKSAPLVLEAYFAEGFEFKVNPRFDINQPPELRWEDFQVVPNVEAVSPQPQQEGLFDKDQVRVQIRLRVQFQPSHEGNYPYTFRIDLIGYFNAPATAKNTDPLNLLKVNGSSILFGAAREMIANFTSRGPFRSVILPSISFVPDNLNKPATPTSQEPAAVET
jgi:preprotein translocase subunit SecB